MKKIIALAGIIAALLCLGTTVYAEDVMKIGLSGEVKAAKAVGNGSGITFTLPDIANSFLIDTIELAIFEKQENEVNYKKFGESKMVENPTSLNISFGFGDVSRYKPKAKYKIAYRYYVKPTHDLSKIVIAGENIKEGWRLVGEVNPTIRTEQGFVFYKNTSPALSIYRITFEAEIIFGITTFSYPLSQLENIYLPSDALQKGVTAHYTTGDFDTEDSLSIQYQLFDGITNKHIYTGIFDSSNKIYSSTNAELVKVVISAKDNWGGESEETSFMLQVDKKNPSVISEFADMGRALRGRNLYSKFTITDNQNEALSNGNVYYSVKRDGVMIVQNVRIPNDADGIYTVDITGQQDGEYEIILTIFDKGNNKTAHILKQTLDNTAPTARFLTPAENPLATEYSTWTNQSKKILISTSDAISGIKRCNAYRNGSWFSTTSMGTIPRDYVFSYDVTNTLTGKILHYFYIYDNACTIDKTNNMANTSSNGNSRYISSEVWLDKTPPSITINADSNVWHSAPISIDADAYDYSSASSISDNSGVKSILYCVTDTEICDNNWLDYDLGVTFNQGGIYYLHIKAVDFAGNEAIASKRIMLNTNAQIVSPITPTDDNLHTIYNKADDLYIIKNTAFSTKYHFYIRDDDISDTIKTEIRLVSQDNSEHFRQVEVETVPNGLAMREVIFNIPYTKADGSILPDGVYTMYLSVSEVKNDGSSIKAIENEKDCEVVIKRNAPSTPVISVESGTVTIHYPDETLSDSLNRNNIKALYKREYKAVIDNRPDTNTYKPYAAPFPVDNMVVTALYTDMAGNIATTSKRVYKSGSDGGEGSIATDGNTATIEESRPANTYYIGIRRDKQTGINSSMLNFLN